MKPSTAVGRLRHRVTFVSPDGPAAADNPAGQRVDDWQPVATVWAAVEPVAGQDAWRAEQLQAEVTHLVYVRYREDVRAAGARWRVTHRGRTLAVRAARDVSAEHQRFLELQCVEQVAPS